MEDAQFVVTDLNIEDKGLHIKIHEGKTHQVTREIGTLFNSGTRVVVNDNDGTPIATITGFSSELKLEWSTRQLFPSGPLRWNGKL